MSKKQRLGDAPDALIAIVGGGIGGLGLALSLQHEGWAICGYLGLQPGYAGKTL